MEENTYFIDVLLPFAVPRLYTYRVPAAFNSLIETGKRVSVQFGKSKIYAAIIISIHHQPPKIYEAKYVLDVLDDDPIVSPNQIKFWEWISTYYLCTLGEVMNAALPAGLKLESQTKVFLNKEITIDYEILNEAEFLVIEALDIKNELTIAEISAITGFKTVHKLLKLLLEKDLIHIDVNVSQRFKPKFIRYIELDKKYADEKELKNIFTELDKAPKQLEALMRFIQLNRVRNLVSKKELIAELQGDSGLNALIKKNVLNISLRKVDRLLQEEDDSDLKEVIFSDEQQNAFLEINAYFNQNKVAYLYGVTSSGKTQLYIECIRKTILEGKQALFLLPEIALTTQLIGRLSKFFGSRIGIYHSKYSDNERVEVYNKVMNGEYDVIIGARSAIFLPFKNLGLVVVDEEHENSYKQYDPSPRYHARDCAIYLANLYGGNVLLGSATPSVESFYNATTGKYGLVKLEHRYGGVNLPSIQVADLRLGIEEKSLTYSFTKSLILAIQTALSKKEQIILFQNRRGYTAVISCAVCAYTTKCINCDVSLTYHKFSGKLHCHYCGFKQDLLKTCPACGSNKLSEKTFGTEKIEEELQELFPTQKIARLDLDTTRAKNSFRKLLDDFESGEINMLVGTQMVSKGLDFENVSLIGIINADTMLNYPDFRAYERSYQLMSQVSGRAGRREKQGSVIIQTHQPHHKIIQMVTNYNYQLLFETELIEREKFHYPPFYRLIQIDIKHKNAVKIDEASKLLGIELKKQFGNRVLGPETPLISRIRSYYLKTFLIKIEKEGVSVSSFKNVLMDVIQNFSEKKENGSVVIRIDVDPQ